MAITATQAGARIALDILSIASVFYLFLVYPIWLQFDTVFYGHLSKSTSQLWWMLAGCIPSIFGMRWLAMRYGETLLRAFPSPYVRFALLITCGMGATSVMFFVFMVKVL
jgi:hypothetical protein